MVKNTTSKETHLGLRVDYSERKSDSLKEIIKVITSS